MRLIFIDECAPLTSAHTSSSEVQRLELRLALPLSCSAPSSLLPRSYALPPHWCLSSLLSCLHHTPTLLSALPSLVSRSHFPPLSLSLLPYVSMVCKKRFPFLWISPKPCIDVHIAMLSSVTKCPIVQSSRITFAVATQRRTPHFLLNECGIV